MTTNFSKTDMMIRKPAHEVFDAVVNPEITTRFWFTKSTGKLEAGQTVTWTWEMYGVTVPVVVKKIEPNERILIEWGNGQQQSMVEFQFKSVTPLATYLTIKNYDFKGTDEEIINQVVDSTAGFTLLLAGLKAYLEHGIQLNLTGDKYPEELRKG